MRHAAVVRWAGLALLPALAACGGTAASSGAGPAATATAAAPAPSASPSASGTPRATPSATTPAASAGSATGCGTALRIDVRGNRVTPAPGTTEVEAGCEVTLVITSDRDNELHVHVAEIEKRVTAGTPLTVTFPVTETGVYEVELHEPQLLLAKLAVR